MEDRTSGNYWQRLAAARASRRRLLGGATIVTGALVLGLAGCSSSSNKNSSSNSSSSNASTSSGGAATNAAGTRQANTGGQIGALTATVAPLAPGAGATNIKKGGTFVVHNGGEPRTLDPNFDTFPYCTAIADNVYNGILQFTPDLSKIMPDLAAA